MAVRRITHVLAVAFLVVILLPSMVRPAKYPRLTMTPRTKQQLKKFFKNHASDMADLVPNQGQGGGGSNDQSEPGVRGSSSSKGSSGGGQSQQAPATNAGMYFYSYSVGTPPQPVSGALDISSELVWTQCSCATCDVTTLSTTPFYPDQSTTAAELPCTSRTCQDFVTQTCGTATECSYIYMYRGGVANTTGFLATDTFTFGASRVDDVVFGCGFDSAGDFGGASGGVIGLGRGPLSLVSQLQAGRFSYYFAPDDDSAGAAESFINFGDDATPQTSRAVSTPLLASSDYPNLYLVGLAGIQVDGKDLAIPRGTFDLRKDGSGGVVLSIAVPVTFLEESAYKLLRQALASKIQLPTTNGSAALGLDLCYTSQSLAAAKIPAVSLVFDGGATMELEVGNYFYMDAGSGLECLTILPSDSGTSLLGSLIQAGTHMIYDISGSTLKFESLEQASPPSNSSEVASRQRRSSAPPPMSPVVVAHFFWVVVFMLL